jgi:hypothetical protein
MSRTIKFDHQYAKAYGVDEAVMIQYIKVRINLAYEPGGSEAPRIWIKGSANDFAKHLPFWTSRQIERILKSLVSQGVLIKENHNATKYDKTWWYAFKDESIYL